MATRVRQPTACRPRSSQRGQAALILVGVLVLGSGYALLRSLNSASAGVERSELTSNALKQAKEALIAYAVSDANRPGSLPCPDANNDGASDIKDYNGSVCRAPVGRLPWKTLGIGDLRDGAGERLWYAVSDNYQANASPATNPINSYTVGSLTVAGSHPASNVVAVVFAVGAPVIRQGDSAFQDRSGGDTVCPEPAPYTATARCDPANYLDVASGEDNADADLTFVTAARGNAFNDRSLAIMPEDIARPLEIRVAREVGERLREYSRRWANNNNGTLYPKPPHVNITSSKGWYPWAATFADPTNPLPGQTSLTYGALPMSTSAMSWAVSSFTVNGSPAAGCTTSAPPNNLVLSCTVSVASGDTFFLVASLNNLASGFLAPPETSAVTVPQGAASFASGPSWSLSTTSSGRLTVSMSGTFVATGTNEIRVTLSPWYLTTTSWLAVNRWYQVLYYRMDSAAAINSTGFPSPQPPATSTPTLPSCGLTVNYGSGGGACAVVMATGSALAGQTRPTASVTDYLEGENATSADSTFEVRPRSPTFNDYVAGIQP